MRRDMSKFKLCQQISYSWLVASTCCAVQLFNGGYVSATMTVLPLYYQKKYGERTLSATIGTVQVALCLMGALPGIPVKKRLGERWTQCIAGVLTAGGLFATAFTTSAWQGMLLSGVCHGAGASLNIIATYSMVSVYFPTSQLPLAIAMMASHNIAESIWAPIIDYLAMKLEFRGMFLALGALNLINLVAAVIYTPKYANSTDVNEYSTAKPKKLLKLTDKKSGIYHLPRVEDSKFKQNDERTESYQQTCNAVSDSTEYDIIERCRSSEMNKTNQPEVLLVIDSNARKSNMEAERLEIGDVKFNDFTYDDNSVSKMTAKEDDSICRILRIKNVLVYMLVAVLATGGICSFYSILGDYSYHILGYTINQFSNGLVIKGVAQLMITVGMTVLTKRYLVSSTTVYGVALIGMLSSTGLMLMQPSTETFYVIMLMWGVFKGLQLSAFYGVCIELTSPEQAVNTYMLEIFFDGIGSLTIPYLAIKAQVDFDPNAGLYVAMTALSLAMLSMVYLSCTNQSSVKIYTPEDNTDKLVQQISFGVPLHS
ncbi:uncharacterized protein [Watersipora subatra]|uniref:uncharacterized protein isoform X2 n=1 Tax=Watersipora subatra TaxID=2589382 RepID=UPI00355C209A